MILLTASARNELSGRAQVVLTVPRGRSERFALHGVTVFCLEMMLLGFAAGGADKALSTLTDLERLRQMMRSGRQVIASSD